MTFCDSAGMVDVWLGMAPSWHLLGPPSPVKNLLKIRGNIVKN